MPAKNNMKPSSLARGKFDRSELFRAAAGIAASGGSQLPVTTPPVSEKIFAYVRREATQTRITINLETVRLAVLARTLERKTSSVEGSHPVFTHTQSP
jgi:hypothetical protein